MKALEHLKTLKSFEYSLDMIDRNVLDKARATIKYSMVNNESQDIKRVRERCVVAMMAEQEVARHMTGSIVDFDVDYSDELTFGSDILSSIEYYGARIEVKTTMNDTDWVNVSIDEYSPGTINLKPFLTQSAADYIIIFTAEKLENKNYSFKQLFAGNKFMLKKKIKKSLYSDSFYIDIKK